MSGTPTSPPQSAREALAALERYQLHLRQLAARGVDAELYRHLSLEMEEVRRCCHVVPVLSAAWVALLIGHAELSQALWVAGDADAAAHDRQRLLQQVLECVRALQAQCMELVPPGGTRH